VDELAREGLRLKATALPPHIRGSCRRGADAQDHRPLRPRRPALHRRTGLHGLDSRGAELLSQVLTEPEEKNSVAIACNESFSDWTKTFTDPRLCAAIVDGLTFGGNIIDSGTDFCRLATTRGQAERGGV
jgi:hypothetical protein